MTAPTRAALENTTPHWTAAGATASRRCCEGANEGMRFKLFASDARSMLMYGGLKDEVDRSGASLLYVVVVRRRAHAAVPKEARPRWRGCS